MLISIYPFLKTKTKKKKKVSNINYNSQFFLNNKHYKHK